MAHPLAQLTVVGKDDGLAHLLRDLPGCVYLGAVPPQDVGPLIIDSDCVVLPSRAEELPMAILEAMAAGRAVIATDVGDIPYLIEPGMNLIPANNSDALVCALDFYMLHPSHAVACGQANRLRVNQFFSIGVGRRHYEQLYDRTWAVGRDDAKNR
jgi:glycosyltransferase involved in cell wall biosynthesis